MEEKTSDIIVKALLRIIFGIVVIVVVGLSETVWAENSRCKSYTLDDAMQRSIQEGWNHLVIRKLDLIHR